MPIRNKARPPSAEIERLALFELIDERRDAGDGSGERGREEGDGGEMRQIALGSFGVATIDVDGVSERLENVEGKRQGQDQRGSRAGSAEAASRPMFMTMLAVTRKRRIHGDPGNSGCLQAPAEEEIAGRSRRNQREITQIPFGVEEIIGQQNDGKRHRARRGPTASRAEISPPEI